MWNKPQIYKAFAITINPRIITCSLLSYSFNTTRVAINSYETLVLDNLELEKLIVFNPTKLATYLTTQYRAQVNTNDTPVLISLHGPSMYRKIVALPHAHPSLEQLHVPRSPQWICHYLHLYLQDHLHYFYVCGIKRSILLQYQLLSINAKLPTKLITTDDMALLQLYRHLSGPEFRHSQLGVALSSCNNIVEHLFLDNSIEEVASLPANAKLSHEDHLPLFTACGLFASQGFQS